MIPDCFIQEYMIYNKGDVIFEQDSPAPSFIALAKGKVEIRFESFSLNSSGDSKQICIINAPCALIDSAKLSNYNYHNVTAVAASKEVRIIKWNLPENIENIELDSEAAIAYFEYLSVSVNEQFALLDKMMSLRTVLDKTLHLYYKDIIKLFGDFEQKLELWSGIRLHDSIDVLRRIKYIKSFMPVVSDFMLENVLNGERKKIDRLVELTADYYELAAEEYFIIDYSAELPAIYIILAGEIELYYSGVALCRFRTDEVIGVNAYFYKEKNRFDYSNVKFKVISPCKIRKCFKTDSQIQEIIYKDKRVLKMMTISILNKYANLLVYNAFIITRIKDDLGILDNNTDSFLCVLFKVDQLLSELLSFKENRRQVIKYYNNIRNVSNNLRESFKQQTNLLY